MGRVLLVMSIPIVFMAVGCTQADGPLLDAAAPDLVGNFSDIGKDLMAIQANDPSGAPDFIYDLRNLCPEESGEVPSGELAARVAETVKTGGNLTMPDAMKLGTALWQTVAARALSKSQVKVLQDEVKELLALAGVADSSGVLGQMAVVQKAVTRRQARWYELF